MRAQIKKRQRNRRIITVVAVTGILVLLVLGFYFAYVSANQLNGQIGQPVTTSDISTLRQLSSPPYGPSGAAYLTDIRTPTGNPFTSHGKPLVVYIGADFCMYCAAQRWPLILALMRFGNFSGLTYMASSIADGNYPTYSFHGSTYSSTYLVFQPYEQEARDQSALDTVPANYSAIFSPYGGYPFLDFGNKYIVATSLLDPSNMASLNWIKMFNVISTNSTFGSQIKSATNFLTALICKLTNDQPITVCGASPINGIVTSIAAPSASTIQTTVFSGAPPAASNLLSVSTPTKVERW